VKRLLAVLLLVVAAAGVALYVHDSRPPWYERIRYPLRYPEIVRSHARNYGLDPAFLAAVIYTESKFDAKARSSSGAVGLMQLTPDTAKGIAVRTGGSAFTLSDLENPEINVRYGSWYLRHLFAKYHDQRIVLAAYNAGQGNVDRWIANGQSIQFPETNAYVDRVEELEDVYRNAYHDELYSGS
jgi:peptidoglycan lytic transglycosylase